MFYINMKDSYNNKVETIDEFETRKEARLMLREYVLAGYFGTYISTRSTKAWRERD